jgi:hypothetical protein
MATPLEQVRCDVNDDVPVAPNISIEVILDGVPVEDLFAYRVQSQPGGFTFRVPDLSLLTELGFSPRDRFHAGRWIFPPIEAAEAGHICPQPEGEGDQPRPATNGCELHPDGSTGCTVSGSGSTSAADGRKCKGHRLLEGDGPAGGCVRGRSENACRRGPVRRVPGETGWMEPEPLGVPGPRTPGASGL